MASLSPNAKQLFLNNSGQPAAGYSLFTYVTGSSTLLVTYSDKAATTPNANPVVLDARGEAILYLLPQSYRYVLKDSLGSIVWTRDNVSAPTDSADLLQTGSNVGGALVGYIQKGTGSVSRTAQDKMRDSYTVNDKGAKDDNFTDTSSAVQLVKTDGGGTAIARFQPTQAVGSTFKFASLGNTDLDGVVLDVPSGVTLSLPSSSYLAYKNVNVSRQTRFLWTDLNCDYYPRPKLSVQRDKTNFITAGDLRYQKLTAFPASSLRFLSITASASDTFASDTPSFFDARGYSYSNKTAGAWYGGFIQLKRGETYSATFGTFSPGQVGIMFRHANGYSLLACDGTLPANNLMSRYYKQTGSTLTAFTDTSFPGRGQYNSYNPTTSTWSVTLTNSGQALITINGRAVSAPIWTTSLGDIFEVAFVWGPGNSAGSCSISDVLIEQNSDPLGRAEIAEVRIFGDSTSDYLLGAWQDDFKDMLDHTHGVKLSTITNFAVSGTNSFDVVTSMDANGFGNAYYVVIAIGTNDIQGGSALSSTEANISGAISRVNSAGRVPVVVIPYMWYGQAQAIAGRGQASLNYDQGARYRARIARLCAELGAVMVDPTRELPEPKPGYVTSDTFNDPLVRDNIHQSALGNKLYAWAIARAIASYHSQLFGYKDYSCGIPADWMRNGWTRGGSTAVLITDSGRVSIQGNFAAGTTTVNTVIMNLPRWARPAVAMTFPCSCNGTGNLVLIKVDTTGDVSLITSPASMTIPDLNTISFNAA